MILNKISILNFKNLEACDLQLSPRLNCLIGQNGMGKTNLLDAVYYLSFCRSAFNAIDSQVITHDKDFLVVQGEYLNEQTQELLKVYCGMKRGQKKHVRLNQKEYRRISQHIGVIPLIFVSPADQLLISGGSEERRRFMDVVISQQNATYIEALTRYNKALQQRNVMLRAEAEPDPELLSIMEEEMAVTGEEIYRQRDAFIAEFIPVFQEVYQQVSDSAEEVSLAYTSHCQRGPLLEVIQRDRFKDRAVGYSLHGIHRDDLEMLVNGYPMRREASQGQSKTFALAMKLAQFDFLKRTATRTTPLLLLDDIFDKLDAHRVEQIIKLVSDGSYGQIFITDTNRDHLDSILQRTALDYKLFEVKNGVIETLKEEHHV